MDTPRKEPGRQAPPNRAQQLERERAAWKLRCKGRTYESIGEALGLTASGAWRLLKRVERLWAKRNAKAVNATRAVQMAQLEEIIQRGFDGHDKSLQSRSRVTQREGVAGDVVTTT